MSKMSKRRSGYSDEEEDYYRRKRKHKHRRREDDEEEDKIVDFERFKHKLSRIFFREDDLIKHGSDEYKDFWKFYRKYRLTRVINTLVYIFLFRHMQEQRGQQKRQRTSPASSHAFKLLPEDPKDLLNRIAFQVRCQKFHKQFCLLFPFRIEMMEIPTCPRRMSRSSSAFWASTSTSRRGKSLQSEDCLVGLS